MFADMTVEMAARAIISGATRALLARESSVVEQAIAETCSQFEGVEGAEPALTRWAKSPAVGVVYESLLAGERDFDDEIVESFIRVGDFYLPDDDELRKTAEQIVSAFLKALLGGLFQGSGAISALAERQEQLHFETREHTDMRFAQMETHLLSLGAAVVEATGRGVPQDPEHAKIEAQIDSARDLINRGQVGAARSVLEMARNQANAIPPELEFRLLTNLGACALASEDIGECCEYLTKAHALQPENPNGIANAALAARLKGDPQRAVELARRSLDLQPRHSHAAAALMEALRDAGQGEQLDEFVAAEDWLVDDQHCAIRLANVRADQGRLDEALALSRRLVDEAPDDYDAHLVLATCLLSASRAGHGADVVTCSHEAEDHATRSLDLLESKELQGRRVHALSIRAGARLCLGAHSEAMTDVEAVLQIIPGDPGALHNKGLILLGTGQFMEARTAFEQIGDRDMRDRALLPLAAACLESDDAEATAALLRDDFSLDRRTWDDIRRGEMLCEAERSLGHDSVGPVLERSLAQEPSDPMLLVLAAKHGEVWGKPVDPASLLERALGTAGDVVVVEVAWRLANLYVRQERFSDAADQFIAAVCDDVSHPAATALLTSLGKSGRLREALAWARKIHDRHPHPPRFAIESEAQILGRVGDVSAAVERWAELCSRDDATTLDEAHLAHALFRSGDRAGARNTVRAIDISELVGEPLALLRLAQLKQIIGEASYLDDAYMARRHGVDEPSVHLGYFSLFLCTEREMTSPGEVGPGCAVLLEKDSVEQWWLILEPGEESRGPNELAPGASLAQELLGRQRDDTVTLQEGIGKLSYRIADIQSKYVRAFQETASGFPTRFPRNTDLSSIPVAEDDFTNFLSVIDKQDRFVRDLQELYRDELIPFASLCARLSCPALELWRACTAGDGLPIRFSTGSASEAEKGQELLRDADSIVLDTLALLTVYELKLADRLRRRFGRVAVPQGVIEELRNLVIEATVGARPSGHVGRNIDGTYALTEMSKEEWSEHQDFARSVLSLAESLEPVASYPELNVDSDDIEQLSALVTEAGVSSIFAGGEDLEDRPLLVSDDLGLANLARGFGVEAVNTQAVLQELRRVGELTDQEYSSLIARLALLNYRFLQVETVDILRLLEASGFLTDEGTRALLSTLEGPECTPESAVSVIAGMIAALALRSLPEHQESLLVSVLLVHLRHGRETTTVLEDCLGQLQPRLALTPPAQARINSLVTQYIKIAGG